MDWQDLEHYFYEYRPYLCLALGVWAYSQAPLEIGQGFGVLLTVVAASILYTRYSFRRD